MYKYRYHIYFPQFLLSKTVRKEITLKMNEVFTNYLIEVKYYQKKILTEGVHVPKKIKKSIKQIEKERKAKER